MKQIPLTKGMVSVVDDEDFEFLSQWKWCAIHGKRDKWYAGRGSTNSTVLMHRVILNPGYGLEVDHIDGNSLNNRRENIRLVPHSDNCKNRRASSNNTSGFNGVYKHPYGWVSTIGVNNQSVYLGLFKEKWLAARVFDKAALHFRGKLAVLNFPVRT